MGNKLSVTLSHSGKQHSYHVAQGLKELGLLNRFYTSGNFILASIGVTQIIGVLLKINRGLLANLQVVSQQIQTKLQ